MKILRAFETHNFQIYLLNTDKKIYKALRENYHDLDTYRLHTTVASLTCLKKCFVRSLRVFELNIENMKTSEILRR